MSGGLSAQPFTYGVCLSYDRRAVLNDEVEIRVGLREEQRRCPYTASDVDNNTALGKVLEFEAY